MGVRSCAKAIVVHDGRLLLNRCRDEANGAYHALPGGGQNPGETLEEAVVRECREETGYQVCPVRFAALFEEIIDDKEFSDEVSGSTRTGWFTCSSAPWPTRSLASRRK